jgi:hypothetical protein
MEGGCRCGKVRYEIDLAGANTLACHCTDCQKHLGAPFSIFTVVPAAQFRWTTEPDGEISFNSQTIRRFCKSCGTYIKWEGKGSEAEAEVNAMTLADPTQVNVDEEIYTRSRLSYVSPIKGAAQYSGSRSD